VGDDWATAGDATAVTTAPVADALKKSRRFIFDIPLGSMLSPRFFARLFKIFESLIID
jgi:hypothetical protein